MAFNAAAGATYYIAVDSDDGDAFDLRLDFSPGRPANDDFANALPLAGTSLSFSGTSVGATGELGEPGDPGSGNSVWWCWTSPLTEKTLLRVWARMDFRHTWRFIGGPL